MKELKKQEPKKDGSNLLYTILGIGVVILGLGVVFLFLTAPTPSLNLDELERGGYSKGAETPKVRIVEFGDFQCPACGAAFPVVKQILSEFPNTVKVTYRHFPLNTPHPYAQKAAEASECANEQGKFWEMHDILFQNQRALTVPSLKQYATQLSLNQAQFDSCLDSGKFASKVGSDYSYGISIGVNSTPTFFINGQKYTGLTYDQFKSVLQGQGA